MMLLMLSVQLQLISKIINYMEKFNFFFASKSLVTHRPKYWRQKKKTWCGSSDFISPIRKRLTYNIVIA